MTQTLSEAGYKHVCTTTPGTHLLENSDGKMELWAVNKNGAGYRLKYKNTHLEFVSSVVVQFNRKPVR